MWSVDALDKLAEQEAAAMACSPQLEATLLVFARMKDMTYRPHDAVAARAALRRMLPMVVDELSNLPAGVDAMRDELRDYVRVEAPELMKTPSIWSLPPVAAARDQTK